MNRLVEFGSPAGRVIEMLTELRKQGRMSGVEESAVLGLINHPAFPLDLKSNPNSLDKYLERKKLEQAAQA